MPPNVKVLLNIVMNEDKSQNAYVHVLTFLLLDTLHLDYMEAYQSIVRRCLMSAEENDLLDSYKVKFAFLNEKVTNLVDSIERNTQPRKR